MKPATLVIGACLLATAVDAMPVPGRNLRGLVDRADLIIVGSASSVVDGGPTFVDTRTNLGRTPGRIRVADIDVDQVIKGKLDAAAVRVQFELPDQNIGYLGLRGVRLRTEEPMSRIAEIIAAVLRSPAPEHGSGSGAHSQ